MRADQRRGLELQIKLNSAPDKIGTHMLVMPGHTKGLPQQSLTHSQTLHGHFASSYKITQVHTFRMNPFFFNLNPRIYSRRTVNTLWPAKAWDEWW
jgi:hypothetical protein